MRTTKAREVKQFTNAQRIDFMADVSEVAWREKSWAMYGRVPNLMPYKAEPKGKPFPTFPTLREAIDHAMRGSK